MVVNRITILITHIRGLITLLITTHGCKQDNLTHIRGLKNPTFNYPISPPSKDTEAVTESGFRLRVKRA